MPVGGLNLSLTFFLRLFVPGTAIVYLYFQAIFPDLWANTVLVSRIGFVLIVGFIFYLIGVGYYAKMYFPGYDSTHDPVRNFIKDIFKELTDEEKVPAHIDKEYMYEFHTLFWLNLNKEEQENLRFYYSFYLFNISLTTIIVPYVPFRILMIRTGLIEPMCPIQEAVFFGILGLSSIFLYYDGRRSLRQYHVYFTYLGRQQRRDAKEAIIMVNDGVYDDLSVSPFA